MSMVGKKVRVVWGRRDKVIEVYVADESKRKVYVVLPDGRRLGVYKDARRAQFNGKPYIQKED